MSGPSFSQSAESDGTMQPQAPSRWPVWPWVALAVAVAIFIGYRKIFPGRPTGPGASHPAVGVKIEQCNLQPLTGDGKPVTAADLQGKVTLVNFWGPWCPPCRMEFPHIMEIEKHYRTNEAFQLLSISCSGKRGSEEEMGPVTAEFLAEQRAAFPTYRDPHQQFVHHLIEVAKIESFVFPTSVVIDQTGTIRGLWEGYEPGDERHLRAVIESTLHDAHKGK